MRTVYYGGGGGRWMAVVVRVHRFRLPISGHDPIEATSMVRYVFRCRSKQEARRLVRHHQHSSGLLGRVMRWRNMRGWQSCQAWSFASSSHVESYAIANLVAMHAAGARPT